MLTRSALPGTFRRIVQRSDVWIYLLVPVILVGLFSEGSGGSPRRMAANYASLFLTTLAIGSAHTLFFMGTCRWTEGRNSRLWWLVPYYLAAVGLSTWVGIEVTARLHALIWGRSASEMRNDLTPTAYVVSILIVAAMLIATHVQSRRRAMEQREEDARQEALRSQLAALQARTDPHFLFNSLNTVASLIEVDPRKAEEAVHRLSAMFRYTLEGSRQELVPLADEIAMVRNYLETESLRFGERLRHEVAVPPAEGLWLLPPLTLQPLVENAIRHGIDQLREGGTVTVRVEVADARLRLTVEDDGPGHDPRPGGTGTGLTDLAARLRLRYGDEASLSFGPTADGFRACVELPATS